MAFLASKLRHLRAVASSGSALPQLVGCYAAREFSSVEGAENLKVLAVLNKAGDAAQEKRLLSCVENELGLREFLEGRGNRFVVTDDKEGPNSTVDKELPDTDIIITTPFHPAYLTPERIKNAPKLKVALTAGIGSDHVNLPAAAKAGLTVAEVTGCNVVSVAEHVVMMILALVRNYIPAHHQVTNGEWNVADIVQRAYDLEGKTVGTVGGGRIGQRVLERLQGFGCGKLLYTDYARMNPEKEAKLNCTYVENLEDMVKQCDVVTINCPLHEHTEHLFDKELISKMKPGAYLVNTARGKICDRDAIKEALESGQLGGYAGDVWYPQPAPPDHPWRTMPRQMMTPHYSGNTLDAQDRIAHGVHDILEALLDGRPLQSTDVIVMDGKLAPQYDKSATERSLEFQASWEQPLKTTKDPNIV